MKTILLVSTQGLMEGKLFKSDTKEIRAREIAGPMVELRDRLNKKGYLVKTADSHEELEEAEAIIFFDYYPNVSYYQEAVKRKLDHKMYLIVAEPPMTVPEGHDPKFHTHFKRVLTYNTEMIDGKKYLEYTFTIPIKSDEKIVLPRSPYSSKKLLTLVSGNKFSPHQNELYGERVNAIRFMEKNHPHDFDLYGTGWEIPIVHKRWASKIKINGAIYRFWPKNWKVKQFPSYRGKLGDKRGTLDKYKFTISYENGIARGWISEKLLEVMLYGSVPVYLGDPEIEKIIPKECFIDKRDYPTYEALYQRMVEMGEEEHTKYLDAIEKFLNSKKAYRFKVDAFVDSVENMLEIK